MTNFESCSCGQSLAEAGIGAAGGFCPRCGAEVPPGGASEVPVEVYPVEPPEDPWPAPARTDPVGITGLFVLALPLVLPFGERVVMFSFFCLLIAAQLIGASVYRSRKSRRLAEEADRAGRNPPPTLDHSPALRAATTLLGIGTLAVIALVAIGLLAFVDLLLVFAMFSQMVPGGH